MPYFFSKIKKDVAYVLSAAVVIGALRVKKYFIYRDYVHELMNAIGLFESGRHMNMLQNSPTHVAVRTEIE